MNAKDAIRLMYEVLPELKGQYTESNEATICTTFNLMSRYYQRDLDETLVLALLTDSLGGSFMALLPNSSKKSRSKQQPNDIVNHRLDKLEKRVDAVEQDVEAIFETPFVFKRIAGGR